MNRARLDRLEQLLSAAEDATADEPAQDAAATLAGLALEAWGKDDPRSQAEHVRQLDEVQRGELYQAAMEELSKQWAESEDGREFQNLAYADQIALCRKMTMEGTSILLVHAMRRSMRRW
jgi:hypothetical protein